MEKLVQRVEALEKKIAALEGRVPEQPRNITISIEPKIECHEIGNKIKEALLLELSKGEPFNLIGE